MISPVDYATYNASCKHFSCIFKGFITESGVRKWRCSQCGHQRKEGVQDRSTFDSTIKELHNARVEGREPRVRKRVKLSFI